MITNWFTIVHKEFLCVFQSISVCALLLLSSGWPLVSASGCCCCCLAIILLGTSYRILFFNSFPFDDFMWLSSKQHGKVQFVCFIASCQYIAEARRNAQFIWVKEHFRWLLWLPPTRCDLSPSLSVCDCAPRNQIIDTPINHKWLSTFIVSHLSIYVHKSTILNELFRVHREPFK